MFFGLLALYLSHFPGWDLVGRDEFEWTQRALFWNSVVDRSAAIAIITSIPAGRRLIEHGRNERWSIVVVPTTVVALGVVGTFLGRFAPANRGTNFRPESVNELWPLSIGLFLVLAYLPVGFLLIDRLLLRRKVPAIRR